MARCTCAPCPFSSRTSVPVVASQILTTPSLPPIAINLPSGLNVAEVPFVRLSQIFDNSFATGVPQSHSVIHRARDNKLAIVTKLRARDFRTVISQRTTDVR